MIPTYFLELADTNIAKDVYKKYFDAQYPDTNDCIVLDKQIADIQVDIDAINKRELSKYVEYNGTFPLIGITERKKSKAYLQELLSKKKNLQSLADCRNKIETVRQEETAQVFTQTSAEAEQRILPKTNQKLYVTIGIGAVVIVTSLVLYLKSRKK